MNKEVEDKLEGIKTKIKHAINDIIKSEGFIDSDINVEPSSFGATSGIKSSNSRSVFPKPDLITSFDMTITISASNYSTNKYTHLESGNIGIL